LIGNEKKFVFLIISYRLIIPLYTFRHIWKPIFLKNMPFGILINPIPVINFKMEHLQHKSALRFLKIKLPKCWVILDKSPKEFYMKNVTKLFGLIALVAIIGFSMAACSSDGNGSSGGDPFQGTWTNADADMRLVAANGSFTVSGEGGQAFRGTYTVSGNNVDITFTGIKTGTDSEWAAYPENPENEEGDLPPKNITGTISGYQVTFEGMTLTKQGGGSGSGGGGSAPGGGGSGGNGGNQPRSSIFELTGIPNDFNRKYAMFYAVDNYGNPIISAVDNNNNALGTSIELIEIKNGKVDLPMWVKHEGSFTRYHGSETINGSIMIFDYKNVSRDTKPTNPIKERFFSVTFSNGAATRTWTQGQDENPNSGGDDGGGSDGSGSGGGDKPDPDDGGGPGDKS
jgi:hypothetical protein